MPKPSPEQIVKDARRLRDERFSRRNKALALYDLLRFGQTNVAVPIQYQKTAEQYHTPALQEEGRAIATSLSAAPVPHAPPPSPQMQPQTTKMENFLMAAHQQLEALNGHIWWKAGLAQIHQKIGWIKAPIKRGYYKNAPTPPQADAENYADDLLAFQDENEAYKKEAGIGELVDYGFEATSTTFPVGDVANPLRIYSIKEVDEMELIAKYDLVRDNQGRLSQLPKDAVIPAGTPVLSTRGADGRKITFIEYWDKDWCCQLIENPNFNRQNSSTMPLVLDEWEHKGSRVPWFACPAFENEVLTEEHKFESPLNGIEKEAAMYNRLRTMADNVNFLTAYPSWQIETPADGAQFLDDAGQPKVQLDFQPGMIFQNMPGGRVLPLPMNAGSMMPVELAAAEARMNKYSLADIARGISPGADTANSTIAQLKRLQKSSLDPLAQNRASQAREMYRYWLSAIKESGEQVYVYSQTAGEMIDLAPEDIVTLNIQVKVEPDTGNDRLIETKAYLELLLSGVIGDLEFYEEGMGKENPEEWARSAALFRLFKVIEPQLQQQVLANLGNTQAIAQMIAASQAGGSAKDAIPGIMGQVGQQQNGQGQGSGGQPRAMGVRSPAAQETTQPAQAAGFEAHGNPVIPPGNIFGG